MPGGGGGIADYQMPRSLFMSIPLYPVTIVANMSSPLNDNLWSSQRTRKNKKAMNGENTWVCHVLQAFMSWAVWRAGKPKWLLTNEFTSCQSSPHKKKPSYINHVLSGYHPTNCPWFVYGAWHFQSSQQHIIKRQRATFKSETTIKNKDASESIRRNWVVTSTCSPKATFGM